MKPRTIDGVTRPDASKPDLTLLDRTVDLLLLFRQYEPNKELRDKVEAAVSVIRAVAARCRDLQRPAAPDTPATGAESKATKG